MAETNGLLNRRTGKSGTEGSNPSVSATGRKHSAGCQNQASPDQAHSNFVPHLNTCSPKRERVAALRSCHASGKCSMIVGLQPATPCSGKVVSSFNDEELGLMA